MTMHPIIFSLMTSVPEKVGGIRNEMNSRERKESTIFSKLVGYAERKEFTDDPKVLSLDSIRILMSLTQSSTQQVTWVCPEK